MKTIEEKAEAYDAAIERAREWSETKNGYYTPKELCEEIFPELAESEDEKIRKTIIDFLKNIEEENESYLIFDNTTTTDMIAWLEKQGSEPNWCHHKVDLSNCSEEYRKAYYDGWNNCNMQHSQCKSEENDVVKCLINGMKFYYEGNEEATWGTEKFSMKVKDILSWLEKQEQQFSWSYEDEANLNNIIWLCNNCINGSETTWIPSQAIRIKSLIERIKERGLEYQKSTEWNKEDERTYKSVLYAFEHNYPLNHEQQKFIKSLKDRVLPQTKEKWSEEDERIYQSIIDDTVQENQLDSKQIDWLKFLKQRYTWKPSKEQMDAMQLAVSCFNCKWTSEVFALLKSLYEDLKKLNQQK